ncbi:MAG: hypothetical protein HWN81_14005 [Candidatus Lokiarchaeota archaeon]|nr:hypothetical protein [Candidatus Lokiarchaeota archaeon]
MERRNFIKVLAATPFFGAALARKCESKEYKFSDQWELAKASDYSDSVCSEALVKTLAGDEQAITTIYAETDLNENRYYDPKWNVNGSWNKAQSRMALISHLAGANHKFDKSYLNTLSTDQLQKLHDDDHNKKRRTTIRRRWFR